MSSSESEPAPIPIGSVFQSDSIGAALTTRWVWGAPQTSGTSDGGRCNYEPVLGLSSASFRATFSSDGATRDPITDLSYPNGYFEITGDETLPQISTSSLSGADYRCSPLPGPSDAPSDSNAEPASAHIEMRLGMQADGVHVSGYVTRLLVSGLRAPLDATSDRPVVVLFSIPAPLALDGSVRENADDSLELHWLSSNGDTAPIFEMPVDNAVQGMTGTAQLALADLSLRRPNDVAAR